VNKLKISAYSLIIISILTIGMLYPLRKLSKSINVMEIRYTDMSNKASRISTFEDSLIYNSDFRSRILGSKFTRVALDSAISNNKLAAEEAIKEVETFYEDRKRLRRNLNIYQGIDKLLILLTAVTGGLMIYYWIKSRNN
jgi:hypothetical protein